MQAIMTKDLKSYIMAPDHDLSSSYNGWLKRYILQKGNPHYGAVLVSMRPVTVGYKLIVSFDWKFLKYKLYPRFDRHQPEFTWLWITIRFEKIISHEPDKVIEDHLKETTAR